MGEASLVSDAEADEYFATRPRRRRSAPGRPISPSRWKHAQCWKRRVEEFAARFPDPVPRPEFWSGFRVVPIGIEFWRDRFFRLHDRFLFTREAPDAPWTCGLLYP